MSVTSTAGGADGMRGQGPDEAVRAWRRLADTAVLLDGFHALKHAVRFGADVPVALAVDRAATLALAGELAPDVVRELDALLVEVPGEVLRALVPRLHPTGVAALAGRPADSSVLRQE
ncbi:rRNA methyltransferase, partial [Streptomyces sp. GXMU-J5]|nr:rRNA methyltransferase [Streptomyces beihaiensis]